MYTFSNSFSTLAYIIFYLLILFLIFLRVEESKGRLIRDDDNDRSDEEGESRIKFSVNQDEIDRKQRREVFEAAQGNLTETSIFNLFILFFCKRKVTFTTSLAIVLPIYYHFSLLLNYC